MYIYTVRKGDTLRKIAEIFGTNTQNLAAANGIENLSELSVGQNILIPNGDFYEVKAGDSLYSIAMELGMSLNELLSLNPQIKPPYIIYPNQILKISPQITSKRTIEVNGYCYPDIADDVLSASLPYLTYLSIFSYSASETGEVGAIDDERLISAAKSAGVAPVMVITNTVEGGGFQSDLADRILNNPASADRLINEALRIAKEKGYYAVDIDFEYIYPSDRESYNSFLSKLGVALRQNGLYLFTAIAPKISAEQIGTLYEAHDYPAHGRLVDRITIMTYEWGYLYGPPLAIAPLGEVRRVINYAVSEIPPEKILLGMPNYAYDWTLPYRKGRPAKLLTVMGARDLAYKVGAEIKFSDGAAAPFFEYYDRMGVPHIVWFDDAKSTNARLDLVSEYGLAGVSFWTINRLNIVNFNLVSEKHNIAKVI